MPLGSTLPGGATQSYQPFVPSHPHTVPAPHAFVWRVPVVSQNQLAPWLSQQPTAPST